MAASYAGADVVHVDASKGMTEWAKENMRLSHLEKNVIRFIVDDCLKFVQREERRGNKYDAIIMDPPSYGRGPNKEVWKLEESIQELLIKARDVLAVDLMERRGFSATDFRQRHPGGKLGAILCRVADIMHKGDEMPLIQSDASMQEALLVMTAKMLGCVGILDENGYLIGIITDGDLRRCMSPDLLTTKAADVMTKNPKVIDQEALIVDAVNMMNNTGRGITNLFVTENGKPVGVIHIHDCLKAGVA